MGKEGRERERGGGGEREGGRERGGGGLGWRELKQPNKQPKTFVSLLEGRGMYLYRTRMQTGVCTHFYMSHCQCSSITPTEYSTFCHTKRALKNEDFPLFFLFCFS